MADSTIRVPTCQSCGLLSSPGESYCRNCGKPLLAPTIAAPPPRQGIPPQSTVTAVSPPAPLGMPIPQQAPLNVGRKRRSPLLLGCLVFLGLIVAVIAAGGIYVWRSASYTPPDRKAPEIPQRASGTMTEFPVDNDPDAPARPTSVQTEALGGTIAQSSSESVAKLPPGIDRSKLSKGASSMTSSTYKPKPKSGVMTTSSGGDVYISVLNAIPNQPDFGNGLATSVVSATGGKPEGVKITSPAGAVYVGSKIKSSQAYVYVLTKQGSDIVILIYSDDPTNQTLVDRLARNVGNGQGLIDYPEVKESLWTLPASTPTGLTLVEINTITGEQLDNWFGKSSDSDDEQRILAQMRPFIPSRLTGARYLDANKQEWASLNFEYESSFQAWRTWLLARSALGLGGAQSTTVRDVNGLYLDSERMRVLVFQKGPYLIFLTGPSDTPLERIVALGNQFQV